MVKTIIVEPPIYRYKNFVVRVNEVKAINQDTDTTLIILVGETSFCVQYCDEKECNDNFELLNDLME